VTWPTSYAALRFRANVQPGEWVLIHAGAGGVGLCAIQIAKALGAKVIATAGSDEKLKVCTEVGGADHAVNYRDKEWFKKVKGE
jgi:NADPH2:quinone reductase